MLDASQIQIEFKAHTKLLRDRAIVKRLTIVYTDQRANIKQVFNEVSNDKQIQVAG